MPAQPDMKKLLSYSVIPPGSVPVLPRIVRFERKM